MLKWMQPKDPSDEDFYEVKIDTSWLGSDEIVTVTMTVDPSSELNIAEPGVNYDAIRTFITGGVVGSHGIEVTLVTMAGRTLQRTVTLEVSEQ